ncbi:MAG: prohibitin family protein [Chloroflexales bacterium]|nr:prohibitin family protein [Chloroflexales bacterium]
MNQQGSGNRSFGRGSGTTLRGGTVASLIGLGVVALIAIIAITNSITIVDAGTRGVLKTFGEVTGILNEGLNYRVPFITSVTTVDVKTQRYGSSTSAASSDLQIVTTEVVINYRPEPSSVDQLVREIGTEYVDRVVEPALQEALKAATAEFTAEELITRRPEVSTAIQETLRERLSTRGITVEAVAITEFSFSEEFAREIEAKQVAEQAALRAQQELRRAQIEAQQQVARAEAEAEARLEIARAEAEALRLQREVISPELLQLRFIERWDGILPRFLGGDTGMIPLVNIPETEFGADQARTTPAPAPANPAPGEEPAAEPTATP